MPFCESSDPTYLSTEHFVLRLFILLLARSSFFSGDQSWPAQDTYQRYQLTVGDYHRMGETGILPPGARVELIEGEIIEMSPIGSKHAGTVDQLVRLLAEACGKHAIVRSQNPVLLSDNSEPQPDIALLKPRDDFYKTSHPQHIDGSDLRREQRYDASVRQRLWSRLRKTRISLAACTSPRCSATLIPSV